MATGGQLRRKHGPIKARLEETLQEAKNFLKQPIEKENEAYLSNYKKLNTTLAKRIDAFQEIEARLQDIAKVDKAEDQNLLQRDESYILLPVDAEETLALLHDLEEALQKAKEFVVQPQQNEEELNFQKQLEEQRFKAEEEMKKERAAWGIQLEEMQQLEINRRQEFADKIERQRVENNYEIEKQRLDLEQKRLEMEERIKIKEVEIHSAMSRTLPTSPTGPSLTSGSTSNKHIKLPKLDFPKFSGNILKWKEFSDCFNGAIDQNDSLSQVDKFNYLRAKLEGEALTSVSGLELTGDNYTVALGILKERYGDEQIVKDAHYKKLMAIPPATRDFGKLRTTVDEVEMHLRTLEALGEDISQSYLISLIKSKIPKETLEQLEIGKGTDKWTVKLLRERLRIHLSAKEEAERQSSSIDSKANSNLTPNRSNPNQTQTTQRYFGNRNRQMNYSTTATLAAYPRTRNFTRPIKTFTFAKVCRYCQSNHFSDECKKYSDVASRKARIQGCCFVCLKTGHTLKDCPAQYSCVYCKQLRNHHRSLCPKQFHFKNNTSSKSELATSCVKSSTGNQDIQCKESSSSSLLVVGESVLMHPAWADLKNPISQKQISSRVFFDSGSHRS